MVLELTPQLETALNEQAQRRGVSPEAIAVEALRERFLGKVPPIVPQDEWERGLLEAARDWGVSLPDSALTSEELYD